MPSPPTIQAFLPGWQKELQKYAPFSYRFVSSMTGEQKKRPPWAAPAGSLLQSLQTDPRWLGPPSQGADPKPN